MGLKEGCDLPRPVGPVNAQEAKGKFGGKQAQASRGSAPGESPRMRQIPPTMNCDDTYAMLPTREAG